jgi:hypothetical protein
MVETIDASWKQNLISAKWMRSVLLCNEAASEVQEVIDVAEVVYN